MSDIYEGLNQRRDFSKRITDEFYDLFAMVHEMKLKELEHSGRLEKLEKELQVYRRCHECHNCESAVQVITSHETKESGDTTGNSQEPTVLAITGPPADKSPAKKRTRQKPTLQLAPLSILTRARTTNANSPKQTTKRLIVRSYEPEVLCEIESAKHQNDPLVTKKHRYSGTVKLTTLEGESRKIDRIVDFDCNDMSNYFVVKFEGSDSLVKMLPSDLYEYDQAAMESFVRWVLSGGTDGSRLGTFLTHIRITKDILFNGKSSKQDTIKKLKEIEARFRADRKVWLGVKKSKRTDQPIDSYEAQ